MKKIFFLVLLALVISIPLGLIFQQKVFAQDIRERPLNKKQYKKRFDGTGPEGMGSRTGRGLGRCQENVGQTYFVYFTGIGCPHCGTVDPVLLKEKVRNEDVLVVEYEIHKQRQNASLLMAYNDKYKTGLGVPLLIFENINKSKTIVGEVGSYHIRNNLDRIISDNKGNAVALPRGVRTFDALDISKLGGLPAIWYKDRIAIKKDINSKENKTIKDFLLYGNIPKDISTVDIKKVPLSGSEVKIKDAIEFNGWTLLTAQ